MSEGDCLYCGAALNNRLQCLRCESGKIFDRADELRKEEKRLWAGSSYSRKDREELQDWAYKVIEKAEKEEKR